MVRPPACVPSAAGTGHAGDPKTTSTGRPRHLARWTRQHARRALGTCARLEATAFWHVLWHSRSAAAGWRHLAPSNTAPAARGARLANPPPPLRTTQSCTCPTHVACAPACCGPGARHCLPHITMEIENMRSAIGPSSSAPPTGTRKRSTRQKKHD